jgi:uncharacterized RDD family membrane protein YckC
MLDTMPRMPHELEEFVAALAASLAVGAVVAAAYWLATGLSPWPGLILGEVVGFGWGATILALTSPRRER